MTPMMGTCSFCNTIDTPVIQSNFDETVSICWRCVYNANAALDDRIPVGAVYCFKCKNYTSFTVNYTNSKTFWAFAGFDSHEEILYAVLQSKGDFTRGESPTSVCCGSCNASIPLWMLNVNKYTKFE